MGTLGPRVERVLAADAHEGGGAALRRPRGLALPRVAEAAGQGEAEPEGHLHRPDAPDRRADAARQVHEGRGARHERLVGVAGGGDLEVQAPVRRLPPLHEAEAEARRRDDPRPPHLRADARGGEDAPAHLGAEVGEAEVEPVDALAGGVLLLLELLLVGQQLEVARLAGGGLALQVAVQHQRVGVARDRVGAQRLDLAPRGAVAARDGTRRGRGLRGRVEREHAAARGDGDRNDTPTPVVPAERGIAVRDGRLVGRRARGEGRRRLRHRHVGEPVVGVPVEPGHVVARPRGGAARRHVLRDGGDGGEDEGERGDGGEDDLQVGLPAVYSSRRPLWWAFAR